ncbi:transposase [Actinoplanes sp. NPDC000266]
MRKSQHRQWPPPFPVSRCLYPCRRRRQDHGRFPDRLCLQGIRFVLHTGIGWEGLPQELGFGSEMTYRRRSLHWTEAGVVRSSAPDSASSLNAANRIDW